MQAREVGGDYYDFLDLGQAHLAFVIGDERLDSGSTVLGMFSDWESSGAETELAPSDTLLLFTDGVPEAMSEDGREFGEKSLIEVVRAERQVSVERLLDRILEKVSTFSGREWEDDVTLVAARCRHGAAAGASDSGKTDPGRHGVDPPES